MQYYFCPGQCLGEPTFLVREIQRCELAVIFFCGVVVGPCGLDFVIEISEKNRFAVGHYPDSPPFLVLVPGQAFVS
jgi:hypothetical protein